MKIEIGKISENNAKMKFTIGSVISGYCNRGKRKGRANIAVSIPGIGVILSDDDLENEPFSCIVLNKEQMIKLRNEIDKEINNEK